MLFPVSKKNETLHPLTLKTGKHNFHDFFQILMGIRPDINRRRETKQQHKLYVQNISDVAVTILFN